MYYLQEILLHAISEVMMRYSKSMARQVRYSVASQS